MTVRIVSPASGWNGRTGEITEERDLRLCYGVQFPDVLGVVWFAASEVLPADYP